MYNAFSKMDILGNETRHRSGLAKRDFGVRVDRDAGKMNLRWTATSERGRYKVRLHRHSIYTTSFSGAVCFSSLIGIETSGYPPVLCGDISCSLLSRSPLAAVVLLLQCVQELNSGLAVFRVVRRQQIPFGMLAVGLFFMGQFALYTYVHPFLETVTRVDVSTLS